MSQVICCPIMRWRKSCGINANATRTVRSLGQNVVEIVDADSSRFHRVQQPRSFQVVESKDTPEGSAPAPKTVSGLARKCPIFNGFCFNEMRAAC